MFKKLNKKGFTLAELLVVVAIIGVLVAISIPIFTSQLEKSRDAVTLANLRSAYAEAQASYLTETASNSDVEVKKTGGAVSSIIVSNVKAEGTVTGGVSDNKELPFDASSLTDMDSKADTYKVTFTYDANGLKTVTAAKQTA